MERPMKRPRIQDPDNRSPRDSGTQMAEGLYTSERGMQSDDADSHSAPVSMPAVEVNPELRRAIFGEDLHRRAMAAYIRKRAGDATVTVAASQVVVNVNDGTSTVLATTVPAAPTDSILSLSDLGSVTIPANLTSISTVTQSGSSLNSSADATPRTTSSGTSNTVSSTTFSLPSTGLNGTITTSSPSITNTVTVTTTSTLEISYVNGTLYPVVVATRVDDDSTTSTDESYTNTASGIFATPDESTYATAAATGDYVGGGALATPTSPSPSASSTASSGGGSGAPSLTPQQQQVVGGVVGSIAGVGLILGLILFLLRRYRLRLKAQGRLPEQVAEREGLGDGNDGPRMSQRSSAIPLTATLASSLRKFRPYSSHTQATDVTASTVPESEKGFQKIAGRKIAPVLSTGGDGYGGDYGAFTKETAGPSGHQRNESSLAGSSFYRDSRGFYGGRGGESPIFPPSPTIGSGEEKPGPSETRDFAAVAPRNSSQVSFSGGAPEGMAALRPSPARTPVTISPAPSSIRLPIQQTPDMPDAPPMPPLARGLQVPDGVGRTLASQDGSRVSARSARSRFAENV